MRFFLILAFFSLFTSCLGPDLSSDEAVRREYGREMGYLVQEDYFCIQRPSSLPGVILVGEFAYDIGCMYEAVFVDGEFGDIPSMTPAAMTMLGWADETLRADLALAWTEDVIYADGSVLYSELAEFAAMEREFTEPTAVVEIDGGVIVTFWFRAAGGMLPEDYFSLRRVSYAADGSLIGGEVLDDFVISIE